MNFKQVPGSFRQYSGDILIDLRRTMSKFNFEEVQQELNTSSKVALGKGMGNFGQLPGDLWTSSRATLGKFQGNFLEVSGELWISS